MNLKEWAASQGVAYVTARRQYAAGTLPAPIYWLGRLVLDPAEVDDDLVGDAEILTWLCIGLYRRGVATDRVRRAVEAATRNGHA
ncbi:MAG TPA: hypothetical protein VFX61_18165 [Micromonosporaceae bacterium]|nr:hypothetical protein [Micromonosporaceae bacterium]